MVCSPSRSLVSPFVSPCLPLSPHMCAFVEWCVGLPEVLSPLVSHCLLTHVCLCWMVCPPSRSLVSPCLPLSPHICVPVLDGVSAFPKSCLPSSPLLSHCLPLWQMYSCVGMCSPSQGLVSSLSPRIRVPVLDGVFAFPRCACVGPHSRLLLSPTCVHVLGDVPAFLRSCFAIVSLLVFFCWMVCPPSGGLVWHCLPSCLPLLDGISAFPRSCLPLSSLVSPCLPLCPIVSAHVWLWWKVCSPS